MRGEEQQSITLFLSYSTVVVVYFPNSPPKSLTSQSNSVNVSTAIETSRLEYRVAKDRTELTKLEWVLMDALWEAGQATAADLQRNLESSQGWAYSTVKTMLDRLVEMGQVKARRVGNVYEYSAKSKRGTVVGRAVDEMTARLFDGSVAPFIQCLIERGKLSADEIDDLQRMLDSSNDEKARPS